MADIADMDHDRAVIRENKPAGLRMIHQERPCACPSLCDFRKSRKCAACGKKAGPSANTLAIIELHAALRGGMPMAAEDLAAVQWEIIGELNLRDDVQKRAASALVGGIR
jgi:hypothetical protein